MSSLLAGKLKQLVAQKFKGKLLKGTISRKTPTAVDSYGDPIPGTSSTYTFEGMRESFTALYLAQTGIPDTDVKILVLLGSVKPVETQPKQGDFVKFDNGNWHQVRRVLEVDPAGASVTLQAFEIARLPA